MRPLALALALMAVGSASASAESGGLVFRRANGSAIVFPGAVRAWCDTQALQVLTLGRIRQSRWQVSVTRKSVRPGRTVRFTWQWPHGVEVFVFDA